MPIYYAYPTYTSFPYGIMQFIQIINKTISVARQWQTENIVFKDRTRS